MKQWLNIEFESSTHKTEQFKSFARNFRSEIKRQFKNTDLSIESFRTNHFFISGFIKKANTDKLVYFSISDVRSFPNAWNESILIRSAKNSTDYTGGSNNYTKLENFTKNVNRIFRQI